MTLPHQRPSKEPRLILTGMGHYFPKTVLSNHFFEELDPTCSAQWIEERVGIKQRHTVLEPQDIVALAKGSATLADLRQIERVPTMAQMCLQPWAQTLERSGIATEASADIDLVISGSSVPDWDIPANACAIAKALNLECSAFDINSACSSFIVDLHAARGLMLSGLARRVAIFNAERYTLRLNYRERGSSVLFGDGAAAALCTADHEDRYHGLELLDTVVHSTPSGSDLVQIADGGHFVQNGSAVQKFAVTRTLAATEEILARNHLSVKQIAYFVGHQANFRMLTSVCNKLGLSSQQHLHNVEDKGNQGGAGAPNVLSMHWEQFLVGDLIVVAVVGSGLTWGAALLRRV